MITRNRKKYLWVSIMLVLLFCSVFSLRNLSADFTGRDLANQQRDESERVAAIINTVKAKLGFDKIGSMRTSGIVKRAEGEFPTVQYFVAPDKVRKVVCVGGEIFLDQRSDGIFEYSVKSDGRGGFKKRLILVSSSYASHPLLLRVQLNPSTYNYVEDRSLSEDEAAMLRIRYFPEVYCLKDKSGQSQAELIISKDTMYPLAFSLYKGEERVLWMGRYEFYEVSKGIMYFRSFEMRQKGGEYQPERIEITKVEVNVPITEDNFCFQ